MEFIFVMLAMAMAAMGAEPEGANANPEGVFFNEISPGKENG